MRLFGFDITRPPAQQSKALQTVDAGRGGWFPLTQTIHEPFTGAWQTNTGLAAEDCFSYWAVLRCINIIASDIAKLELKLLRESGDVDEEADSPAFSPVLRTPNHFQNSLQFFQSWMESKLTRGNTYVLKERDNRDVVTALYVLDPWRVRPLVSDADGSVFYELQQDYLNQVQTSIVAAPASEVIHDRWNTLYHPLCGLSPLHAAGLTAGMGKKIQNNSTVFFNNASMPSGMLLAPERISDDQAKRLKDHWEVNYGALQAGKVVALGGGLEFKPLRMTSQDSQLIEQLKWTDSTIAGAFGVPAYMINAGTAPAYNNVDALSTQYFTQCLQVHIKSIEKCLNAGLGLVDAGYSVQFELDDLLRMDTASLVTTLQNAIKGIITANEARKKLGYGPKPGCDTVLTQQQNVSVENASNQEIKPTPAPGQGPQGQGPGAQPADGNPPSIDAVQAARALLAIHKGLNHAGH
jgi:HK97 family phage portal protein